MLDTHHCIPGALRVCRRRLSASRSLALLRESRSEGLGPAVSTRRGTARLSSRFGKYPSVPFGCDSLLAFLEAPRRGYVHARSLAVGFYSSHDRSALRVVD